jgi:tol-pal system beta propeller repeat protein TolB
MLPKHLSARNPRGLPVECGKTTDSGGNPVHMTDEDVRVSAHSRMKHWFMGGGVLLLMLALLTLMSRPVVTRLPPVTLTLEPSPCGAAWLPMDAGGDGKIAFTSSTWGGYAICIMNPDGSGMHTVVYNSRRNFMISWSPDNRRISFNSADEQGSNVYLINLDGSDEVQVTHSNIAIGGSWSPDGQQIVFTHGGGGYPVHIVNIDGTPVRVLPPLDSNDRPRWSTDGDRLLFWSARNSGSAQIYTMKVDGTDWVQLTNRGFNTAPSWSPDGSRIVFVSDREYQRVPADPANPASLITGTPLQGVYQIYVMDADGSNVEKLTDYGDNFYPSWSPDGNYIAFARRVGQNQQIFVMRADGSNPVQLTFRGDNYAPVWAH